MKVFGERLLLLRHMHHMTQQTLAEKLGLSKQVISNYENDRRNPELETIVKIADLLDVTTDYLLGMTERNDGRD